MQVTGQSRDRSISRHQLWLRWNDDRRQFNWYLRISQC